MYWTNIKILDSKFFIEIFVPMQHGLKDIQILTMLKVWWNFSHRVRKFGRKELGTLEARPKKNI